MAGSVGDEANQFSVGGGSWVLLVHQVADGAADIDIGPFVDTANIVGFTECALAHYGINAGAVIFDIQPVANIAAVAIDGYLLLLLAGSYDGGDKLFGVLTGAVVIRAVAGGDWQAVGMVPGSYQMV